MKGKFFILILVLLFAKLNNSDVLLNIPKIDLKPVVKSATDLVNDLAEFTINEILNFKSFKSLFNKVYATLELENIALLNFLINQRDVDEHNKKYKSGQVSYRRAVCEYSDMSTDDMNKYVNRFHMPEMKRNRRNKKVKIMEEKMAGNEEVEEEEAGVVDGIVQPITNVLFGTGTKKKNSNFKTAKNDQARIIPILKEDKLPTQGKSGLNNAQNQILKEVGMDTQGEGKLNPQKVLDDSNANNQQNIVADEYPDDYITPEYEDYPDESTYNYEDELLVKLKSELKYLTIHSIDDLLNYITEGFNTQVLNQGLCGSCWSFSAAAAIEAAWFIQTGEIVKLSEQQLIDCNRDKDNDGCEGGNMANAFKFVQNNGGISLSSRYPYRGNDTYRCKYVSPDIPVVDHELLDPGDEDLLLESLIEHGPIAVAIDASLKTFQTYKSGVYYDSRCSDQVNHAMLLVGYGTVQATNEDYWILKNTYGKTWGINGYMKLARNRDNHCGITEFAVYPICS